MTKVFNRTSGVRFFSALALMAAMALTVGTAQTAKADIQSPIWNCSLKFDVKGGGVKVLLGHYKLRGQGYISCADLRGNVEQIPVKVTVGSNAPFSIGIGKMRLVGMATGIGLAGEPTDLLGRYFVGSVRGSLGVGAGVDVALHAARGAFTLNTALQVVQGVGVNIGLDSILIEAI